jgi:DNA-binding response OmpR family regulator
MNMRPATILIVDDEDQNRKLLDVFIKADGHTTIFATDGESGVKAAVQYKPNLILLDLMMPDMDGFDVARLLKSNIETKAIPIIVVTSLDDVASRRRMSMSGVDEFITKPMDRQELSLRIFKLLQEQHDVGNASTNIPAPDEKKNE